MCPDCASRQLETSPCTKMSVKFLASRSRILPVNSLTVQVLRLGIRLKVSCCVIILGSRDPWTVTGDLCAGLETCAWHANVASPAPAKNHEYQPGPLKPTANVSCLQQPTSR